MWASWRGIEYTIKGKVMASPKSGLWWVLWIWVCPWLILAPKVFQLCIKHLVFGFVQVHVSSWCLSLFLVPSWSSSMPLYPQSVTSQGTCLNSLLFHCFQFKFTFESIKELESASCWPKWLPYMDPTMFLLPCGIQLSWHVALDDMNESTSFLYDY